MNSTCGHRVRGVSRLKKKQGEPSKNIVLFRVFDKNLPKMIEWGKGVIQESNKRERIPDKRTHMRARMEEEKESEYETLSLINGFSWTRVIFSLLKDLFIIKKFGISWKNQ